MTSAEKTRRLRATIMSNRSRWGNVVFACRDDGTIDVEPRSPMIAPPPREHVLVRLVDLIGHEPHLMPIAALER